MLTMEYSKDLNNASSKEDHKYNVCKHFTNSIFEIANHVRPWKTFNCEESVPEIYHCKDCDFKTDLTIFFKKHIQQIHLIKTENGDEPQSVEYTLQSFICRSCSFETYSSLQWLKHQQVGCLSNEATQEDAQGQILPCKYSQGCVCKHCSTMNSANLRINMTMILGETSFECYHCGFKSRSKPSLKRHIFTRHRPFENWLYCDQCSFKTTRANGLRIHNQKHHLSVKEIKWYQCMHCPFKTKYNSSLGLHKLCKHKSDVQINWYKCGHCKFKSKLKNKLNEHVHIKHTEWKDKDLFPCGKCPFKTKSQRHLNRHNIRRHLTSEEIQWFQCEKCPYKAKTGVDLKSHTTNKHTEWTPADLFHCDKCSFKTKYKACLTVHNINKHLAAEEIQWFQCDECPYKAKIRKHLMRHKTRRHRDKQNSTKCTK